MPEFHFKATTKKGEIQEGDLITDNEAEVIKYLTNVDLIPISIRRRRSDFISEFLRFFKKSITIDDKLFLTRYLSLMLSSGLDIVKSIDILREDLAEGDFKSFLLEVRSTIEKGQPFFTAFAAHPDFFSKIEINLVKAGEVSGSLDKVLNALSNDLEREREFRSRLRSALIYPTILITASILVMFLVVTFVMPRLANVFSQTGEKIPTYSRVVIGVSLFLNENVWYIITAFVVLLVGAIYFFTATDLGRRTRTFIFKHTPVLNKLFYNQALRNFSNNLSSLLSAGVPITQALDTVSDAVGDEDFRLAILRISQQYVPQGMSLGESFRREIIFPRIMAGLVAVGEQAGHLPEILKTMGNFYEVEVDSVIKNLVNIIEPVVLIFIGLIVAAIALSVIVPIYQVVTTF